MLALQRLFKYISGENEAGSKIEMTAPVRVKVYPSQGPFCGNNFTVSFFVPFAYQVGAEAAAGWGGQGQPQVPAMRLWADVSAGLVLTGAGVMMRSCPPLLL
jgi:hypothetical protein